MKMTNIQCPIYAGAADNGCDRELPPNPYVCTKCEERDMTDELMQTIAIVTVEDV